MGQYTKPRVVNKAGGEEGVFPASGAFADSHPAVWEHLSEAAHDDGSRRETTSVLVVCDDGRLKAWINDRANGLTAWVTGRSWEGLWEAVEEALVTGEADWRPSQRKPSGGRRK